MHGLCVLFKAGARLHPPRMLECNNPLRMRTEPPERDRVGGREGGGYLQNFEVVETLEGVAWYIPQLIPWDTSRRERNTEIKREKMKKNKYKLMHRRINRSRKGSFAFCLHLSFWIGLQYDFILEFLLWGYCWGSMQITIFYSLQCGCYWPNAHPETLTNSGSPDEWVKTQLNETETGFNKCSVKVYWLVCMQVCLRQGVYYVCAHGRMCVQCERACDSFHVLEVNWARSEGPCGQRGRETTHIHTSNPISLFIKHST